jgi:hypothetical protein
LPVREEGVSFFGRIEGEWIEGEDGRREEEGKEEKGNEPRR